MRNIEELVNVEKEIKGNKVTLKSIENLGFCSHHSGVAELLEGKVLLTFPDSDYLRLKVFLENREDEGPFSGECYDITNILKVLCYDVSVKNYCTVEDIVTENNPLYDRIIPVLEEYFGI